MGSLRSTDANTGGGHRGSPVVVDLAESSSEPRPAGVRIVVGVDCSEGSVRALMAARRLARLSGASVTVVFVRHRPPMLSPYLPGDWALIPQAAVEDEVRRLMVQWLSGLRSQLIVTEGSVASELERIADEVGAEVLVIGRSRGGLLHHLWSGPGSVAGHAVRASPVPVLVVR